MRTFRFRECIAQDMVAIQVSPDLRPLVIGAPAYFGLTLEVDISTRPAEPSPLACA